MKPTTTISKKQEFLTIARKNQKILTNENVIAMSLKMKVKTMKRSQVIIQTTALKKSSKISVMISVKIRQQTFPKNHPR